MIGITLMYFPYYKIHQISEYTGQIVCVEHASLLNLLRHVLSINKLQNAPECVSTFRFCLAETLCFLVMPQT
jgi:hypothetical protein